MGEKQKPEGFCRKIVHQIAETTISVAFLSTIFVNVTVTMSL